MSILFACGAECRINVVGAAGGLTITQKHWTVVAGTPTIDTGIFHAGAASYKFDGGNESLTKNFATANVIYMRGYFRVNDATPSGDAVLFLFGSTGQGMRIGITTGGVLQMRAAAGVTTQNYSGTLVADEFYGIEAQLERTTGAIDWRVWRVSTGWVDQTKVVPASAAVAVDRFLLQAITTDTAFVAYWDDVVVGTSTALDEDWSDTTPKGGEVKILRPTADGAHSFAASGDFKYENTTSFAASATDVWSHLDATDMTQTAEYISQNVSSSGLTKYCRVTFPNEGTYTLVHGIMPLVVFRAAGTTACEMNVRMSDDGTNWTDLFGNWGATGLDVSETTNLYAVPSVAIAPPSGGSWDITKVNGLEMEFGMSDDISPVPFVNGLAFEVAFIESSAPTVTATLLGSAAAQPSTIAVTQQALATLLGSAAALVSPQARLSVATTLLGAAAQAVAPSLLQNQFANPTLLGQALANLSPSVQQRVVATLLGSAAATVSPTQLAQSVMASLLGSAASQFSPSVQQRVVATLLGSAASQLSAVVTQQVQAVLVGSAMSAVSPTVTQAAGAQSVSPSLLGSAAAIIAPTMIAQRVEPVLVGSAAVAVAPVVLRAQFVNATLLGAAAAVIAPSVQQRVVVSLVGTAAAVVSPSVTQSVAVALVGQAMSALAPTLSVPGAQTVTAVLLGSAASALAPTVTQVSPQTVTASLVGQAAAVLAPDVQQRVEAQRLGQAMQALSPQLTQSVAVQVVGAAMAALSPTVVPGAVSVSPTLLGQAIALQSPTVAQYGDIRSGSVSVATRGARAADATSGASVTIDGHAPRIITATRGSEVH